MHTPFTQSSTIALKNLRRFHSIRALALASIGFSLGASVLFVAPAAAATGRWIPTGDLVEARYSQTATLLSDGRVLAAGGSTNTGLLASAELYDPATGTWNLTGSLHNARVRHVTILLQTGKVITIAGVGNTGGLDTTELYDPATGLWTLADKHLLNRRQDFTGTLLNDGRVLVAGGIDEALGDLNESEIYDPATGNWTSTGFLNKKRSGHTATLLPDGKVLVTGGYSGNQATAGAEIYDPATATWTTTGSMTKARAYHTATLLADGRVLIGGFSTQRTELYDEASGTFTATGSLPKNVDGNTATLLPSGQVLYAGGYAGRGRLETIWTMGALYDPVGETWTSTTRLNAPHGAASGTLLLDGSVLLAAGADATGAPVKAAELYQSR